MIIPELPNYLTSLGGGDYKGLIISIFTLAAGLSRPFSGKLTDTIGRIPVMIFGSVICFLAGILYPILTSLAGFFLLRFFHGLSTGFKPTGTAAYVADIVSAHHRGEAMGVLGVFLSLGMAAGPVAGSYIAAVYSLDIMFYLSGVIGLLSVAILIGMKETVPNKVPFRWGLLKISRADVYEPRVLPPSIVLMLNAFSFGVILTIIPDFSDYLGISNKGQFFTYFTLASLLIRLLAGKISDKYGRVIVLKVATIGLAFAMFLIARVETPFGLSVAAVVFGIAVGMSSPTVFAWTIDLSLDEFRGRAMSTLYIFLEIGIGLGALYSGFVYNNDPNMFFFTFATGTVLCLLSFFYLVFISRKKKSSISFQ